MAPGDTVTEGGTVGYSACRLRAGTELDLVELEVEARPRLHQRHLALLARVDVVAQRDEVVLIDHRDDAPAVGLGHGEEVLQDGRDAPADLRAQVVLDQVRVGLGHRRAVLDVMPHHDVVQAEVGSRPVRHVAHYNPIRHAAVLLHDDQVTVALAAAHVGDLVDRVPAAVHALRVGHQQLDLLEELHELARRVARGGDQDLRVGDTRVEVL
eukprot:scaffold132263_cov60-Phaeocystis_antarctica.AAC.1